MNEKSEWEAKLEIIVEKSSEKIKNLIMEKEELYNRMHKMNSTFKQDQMIIDTLKDKLQRLQDETVKQLREKSESQLQIDKKKEENAKLAENIKDMEKKLQESAKSYEQEYNAVKVVHEKNEQDRKQALNQDLVELHKQELEKQDLLIQKEMLAQELEELQVIFCFIVVIFKEIK